LTTNEEFDMSEEIMTIKEVSEYLKMNYRTVYRLAEKGEIPAFKVGKNWRVRKDLLDKWIEDQIDKKSQRGK
jgi:excisionase family DNA binding protein